MVLLCDIRSHCCLYLLFVMAVEHNLVLSMLSIVILIEDIMRCGMLLMTLLLYFGHQS